MKERPMLNPKVSDLSHSLLYWENRGLEKEIETNNNLAHYILYYYEDTTTTLT